MLDNAQVTQSVAQPDPFLIALRNEIGVWRSEAIWWQLQHSELLRAFSELQESFTKLKEEVESGKQGS